MKRTGIEGLSKALDLVKGAQEYRKAEEAKNRPQRPPSSPINHSLPRSCPPPLPRGLPSDSLHTSSMDHSSAMPSSPRGLPPYLSFQPFQLRSGGVIDQSQAWVDSVMGTVNKMSNITQSILDGRADALEQDEINMIRTSLSQRQNIIAVPEEVRLGTAYVVRGDDDPNVADVAPMYIATAATLLRVAVKAGLYKPDAGICGSLAIAMLVTREMQDVNKLCLGAAEMLINEKQAPGQDIIDALAGLASNGTPEAVLLLAKTAQQCRENSEYAQGAIWGSEALESLATIANINLRQFSPEIQKAACDVFNFLYTLSQSQNGARNITISADVAQHLRKVALNSGINVKNRVGGVCGIAMCGDLARTIDDVTTSNFCVDTLVELAGDPDLGQFASECLSKVCLQHKEIWAEQAKVLLQASTALENDIEAYDPYNMRLALSAFVQGQYGRVSTNLLSYSIYYILDTVQAGKIDILTSGVLPPLDTLIVSHEVDSETAAQLICLVSALANKVVLPENTLSALSQVLNDETKSHEVRHQAALALSTVPEQYADNPPLINQAITESCINFLEAATLIPDEFLRGITINNRIEMRRCVLFRLQSIPTDSVANVLSILDSVIGNENTSEDIRGFACAIRDDVCKKLFS